MTWFGAVSAWGAAAMAVMFAVNAYFQSATGVFSGVYIAVAAWLGLGAYLTLRKLSGGLRLLAGGWGLAAGVLLLPYATTPPDEALRASPLAAVFLLIAVIGLVLTVRHKESK